MSKKRYEWSGEIIDAGDGYRNLEGEELADRLNALSDENADLRRHLAEAKQKVVDEAVEIIRDKAGRGMKPDMYDSDGSATQLDHAYDEGVINSMNAVRSLIPTDPAEKEASDE